MTATECSGLGGRDLARGRRRECLHDNFAASNNGRGCDSLKGTVPPSRLGKLFGTDALRIPASKATEIWLPTLVLRVMLRAAQRLWLGLPSVERPRAQ